MEGRKFEDEPLLENGKEARVRTDILCYPNVCLSEEGGLVVP